MGLTMCGWIEIQDYMEKDWIAVVRLSQSLVRYDDNRIMHSYLFGTYGESGSGLFNRGGIPNDAAAQTRQDCNSASSTWVLWSELKHIQWEERIVEGLQENFIDLGAGAYNPVLTGGYELIFDIMKTLSNYHGDHSVRLVIWFE